MLKAFYPLHDRDVSKQIKRDSLALTTSPWGQPFNRVKEYFGEKVGLFYVFTGHYSLWLFPPALVGVVFQMVVVGSGDYSHPVLCFFGLLVR